MKTGVHLVVAALTATFAFTVVADTHYVNVNNPSPTPPYTNWPTAATNIQDAVDAATVNDTVLVTNGVYDTGGKAVYGTMTNRVALTKFVILRSVNGPSVTFIAGRAAPGTTNGDGAIRCLYASAGALVSGFTFTNGHTRTAGDIDEEQSGGGVRSSTGSGGVLTNCFFIRNSAALKGGAINAFNGAGKLYNCKLENNEAGSSGGGSYGGTLTNCALVGNWANAGGGSYDATLVNCTVTGNSARSGGGAQGGTIKNSLLYYNNAALGANYSYNPGAMHLINCCTTPLPIPYYGSNNITKSPQLASTTHISSTSPCRNAGSTNFATGTDIDGERWTNPPSIGCDEYRTGTVTGALSVAISPAFTNVVVGHKVKLTADILGRTSASFWDFGDGTVVSNQPYTAHAWVEPGNYSVTLRALNESFPLGIAATITMNVVTQPVHYVSLASTNPVAPYSSWETAATNIQDAVDVATIPGSLVLASNGVYEVGERAVANSQMNRLAVNKPVQVRSTGGAQVTTIRGGGSPYSGTNQIRCVYLGDGAAMSGFFLIDGSTIYSSEGGGGAYCASVDSTLVSCVLSNNSVGTSGGSVFYGTLSNCWLLNSMAYSGGGAAGSTLINCFVSSNYATIGGGTFYCLVRGSQLTGNSANAGGGDREGVLENCLLSGNSSMGNGGGVDGSTLDRCVLSGNSSGAGGGGAMGGRLSNCLLTGNSALYAGGGARGSELNNCTLVNNSASGVNNDNGGGGASLATLNNCVVYGNTCLNGSNTLGCLLRYSCTEPMPTNGVGNITNAPIFVNQLTGDLRLQSNSPCINAGSAAYGQTTLDLDGNPRIIGGALDMGAYENGQRSTANGIPWAWLLQYGLSTDGSADLLDTDGEGANNWQEWRADTVPTNATSALRMAGITNAPAGLAVSWESVTSRSYWLERGEDLGAAPAFQTVATNLPGAAGVKIYNDTSATNGGPYFYRVGVH